jgi:prepilin-type processing-associated H-X9-DG protein
MRSLRHAFGFGPARGFTVAELLVIIGIIAALVAILLPALVNARRQAARLKCAASLAQIGHAVGMYANDYKGRIPVAWNVARPGWPTGFHWYAHLSPYLSGGANEDEFVAVRSSSVLWGCPAWDGPSQPTGPPWGESWNTGYTYSALPLAPSRPVDSHDNMLFNPAMGARGRYFKLSEIQNQTERGFVTDGWLGYVLFYNPPSPSRVLEKQDFHTMSPTRHGGWNSAVAVNVLFFDGHVVPTSAMEARYAFADPMHVDPWLPIYGE